MVVSARLCTWEKRGRLIGEALGVPWAKTHAALPVVDSTTNGGLRIYASARDEQGRARIGCWDCAPDLRSASPAAAPVLEIGDLGAFDDSGVTSSCVVTHGSRKFLYYTGWTRAVAVPFHLFVGLAVSEDGGQSFRRYSRAPILERNEVDPLLTASPFVLIEEGIWRMWYVSGVRWTDVHGQSPRHYYHIRYAESADGIHWNRNGTVCIDFEHPDEYAIGRPCVVHDGAVYRMWYCWRGRQYRIGYAESLDGVSWSRMDDLAGIAASDSGWDSEMIAYPFVFDYRGQLVMLYNGNGYGKTGCGIAFARG